MVVVEICWRTIMVMVVEISWLASFVVVESCWRATIVVLEVRTLVGVQGGGGGAVGGHWRW